MNSDGDGAAFQSAVDWLGGILVGAVATDVGILAVAAVGILLLDGRFPAKRAVLVITGCFILFSAPTIARGLVTGLGASAPEIAVVPIDPAIPATPPPVRTPYDPYAGAAVPLQQQQQPLIQ